MAESIVRLKVDSKEYDANLKRAAQGLLNLESACRKAGGIMNVLEDENRDYIKSLGQMATQATDTRGSLREMTRALADMTSVYRRMSDEEKNGEFGQELAKQIAIVQNRAGELQDTISDVTRTIKAKASDTSGFDKLAGSTQAVVSVFQVGKGAAELFGLQIEDNLEVMAKLQSMMAITSGLTQIQNTLQKESAVMMGVQTIQTKALAAAKNLEGKSTIFATAAQTAFNLVAKMNPYVLLASAIAAAATAVLLYSRHTKEATEAEKQRQAEAKRLQKQQAEMNATIGRAVGNLEAQYRALQVQWSQLKTASEKNKWIEENSKAFNQLGLSVRSVSDAENVLVNMAPQVVAALKAVAEADAYLDLYKKAITERAEKWQRRTKSMATGDYYQTADTSNWVSIRNGLPQEWQQAGIGMSDYLTRYPSAGNPIAKLNEAGAAKINKIRQSAATQLNKKLADRYNKDVDDYMQMYVNSLNEAAAAKSEIPTKYQFTGGTVSLSGGVKTTTAVAKQAEQEIIDTTRLTQENIQRLISDLQNKVKQADIGTELFDNLTARLSDAKTFSDLLQKYLENGIEMTDFPYEELWKKILFGEGDTIPDSAWQAIEESLQAKLSPPTTPQPTTDIPQGRSQLEQLDEFGGKVNKFSSGLGSITSGLSSIGVKIPRAIDGAISAISGLSQIISGVTSLLQLFGTSTMSMNSAAVGANTVAITALTSAVSMNTATNAIPFFHNGGIVHAANGYHPSIIGGNSFSGDNIPALVNSGEIIMNQAQQGNLVSQLTSSGGETNVTTTISAEDLVLIINNFGRRKGLGTLKFG